MVTTEIRAGMGGSTDKGRGKKCHLERNMGRGRESWPLWDSVLPRKHRPDGINKDLPVGSAVPSPEPAKSLLSVTLSIWSHLLRSLHPQLISTCSSALP